MDGGFLARLEDLRHAFKRPMLITSGYRCPDYNARVATSGRSGPHTTGLAVDVAVSGEDAYDLLLLALQFGFTGLGIKQRGSFSGRFIHIDDLPAFSNPRPRVWSY